MYRSSIVTAAVLVAVFLGATAGKASASGVLVSFDPGTTQRISEVLRYPVFGDLMAGTGAVGQQAAVPHRQHPPLPGLFSGRVGKHDPARRDLFGVESLDNDLLTQGYQSHFELTPPGKGLLDPPE